MVAGGRCGAHSRSFARPRYHRPVRRLIQLAIIALGIRAFLRWRKRRRQAELAPPATAPTTADPADELRRKLAESREADEPVTPPPASVSDRRAEVHDAGRAALDEMTSSDES